MARKTGTEVATAEPKTSLVAHMAAQSRMDPMKFLNTIKKTCIKRGDASDEQIAAFLMVANKYNLDPIMKHIYAYPDKGGGIVPFMSIDGWIKMANDHPQFDNVEFRFSEKMVSIGNSKPCHEWCEAAVYRKDRSRPTVIREYFDECFRATDPWKSMPKRMLRNKAESQAYRHAFGFSGIYEEDEAERIVTEGKDVPSRPSSTAAAAREALQATPPTTEPSEEPETAPEAVDEVFEGDLEPPLDDAVEDYEVMDEDDDEEPRASRQQVAAIKSAVTKYGWSEEAYDMMLVEYGVSDPKQLSTSDALHMVRELTAGPEGQEKMEV